MNFYIDRNGSRWRLCKIISRILNNVIVELYDGTQVRGIARRGLYGELIEAK